MRLFFAVDLPAGLRRRLATLADQLREPASRLGNFRWVAPANLHVTLKFLGEVEAAKLRRLLELAAACRGESLVLQPGNCGYFPSPERPRVFWLGFSRGGGELCRLAALVDEIAVGIGVEPEKRPLVPHLTLARIRQLRSRKAAAFRELAARSGEMLAGEPSFPVKNFVLYQSTLTPKGAVYRQVEVFPLGS